MKSLRYILLCQTFPLMLCGQATLFHYRVSDGDTSALAGGTVPNLVGADGAVLGALSLSSDIPTNGVPVGAGNRSLDNGGSGGVTAAGTRQLANAEIVAAGGFSFEAWFKAAGGGNVNSVIDYAGTEKLVTPAGTGQVRMGFASGSGNHSLGSITAGQWHYVAVVFEHDGSPESGGQIAGTLTWYLDSKVPAGSASVTKDDFGDSLNRTIGVATHPLGFGSDYFDGLVYEPRVTLGPLAANSLLYSSGPRIESFATDAEYISAGGSAELSWIVSGANTIEVQPGIGEVPTAAGSVVVSPTVTTTYTLHAVNAGDSSSAELTVFVDEPVAEPVINEFLADNSDGLRDEDGESSDWIEIRNPNPFTIALDGWSLTDDPLALGCWGFPPGTELPAHSYRVVFASAKDRADPAGELHTNFRLARAGEYLAIIRPDLSVAQEFSPEFPPQFEDKSFGRIEDGAMAGYFETPTPGAANGAGVAGFVADTKFEPNRGILDLPTDVTITSATPGATIVYTTDASTPSLTNGTPVPAVDAYTTAIAVVPISLTTTLRAAAFLDGFQQTNSDTHTYVFLSDVIGQSPGGETPPGWPAAPVNGQVFDYGMDPAIVNHATWGPDLIAGLKQIPSISIVTDQHHLTSASTGIYTHAGNDGDSWERPGSIELILPDDTPGFQVNGGVRIRGGFSRGGFNPKHSFRLFFRGEYGASRLKYPLFGDEGTDDFDKIDLRTAQNYAWSNDTFNNELHNSFIRDVFHRDTQRDMGQPYTRSRYYHLYLNGLYWGIYQTQERAESAFANTYFGGNRDNWDVIKPSGGATRAVDGTITAYNALHAMATAGFSSDEAYRAAQGRNPDGSDNPAIDRHLDVDNLIDYMITNIYCGNRDGPLALGGGGPNNFHALRNRDPAARDPWRFFCHDSEHSMAAADHDLNTDLTGPTDTGTQASHFNPRWLSQQLAQHPDYRRRFGDRVQGHFFNGGALSEANALARWNTRASEIDFAIIGESARWGDQHNEPPLDKQTWENELDWVRNTFITNRGAVVLNQFRAAGLFPSVQAPVFSQHGGAVAGGTAVTVTAPAGAIYYTTDGTDPRPGSAPDASTLLAAEATAKALIPTAPLGDGWKGGGEPYDDGAWLSGTTGVGYEAGTGYEAFIGLDVIAMRDSNPSVFMRVPFNVADPTVFTSLILKMRYDDGFVAYLNGVEISSRLAPPSPAWDSTSANGQTHEAGQGFDEIDVSAHLGALVSGPNILAIHGLNSGSGSSDMLIQPELVATAAGSSGALYTGPIILDRFTELRAAALDGAEWSALTAATFLVDTVPANAGNLVVSGFSYRPAVPSPAEDPGGVFDRGDFEFIELLNIGPSIIDLSGVRFTVGIDFSFAPNTILGANQRLLLVKNESAFEIRHGTGLPVAGEFGGSLSNDGEQITLIDSIGQELRSFEYNDQPPWPVAADGDGYSLVLRRPGTNPDHSIAENWRSSTAPHGTPGESSGPGFAEWMAALGIVDAHEDADHDSLDALQEFATGGDPFDFSPPAHGLWFETVDVGGVPGEYAVIAVRRALNADDVTIVPERSVDLTGWQSGPLHFVFLGEINHGDGTATLSWRSSVPVGAGREFLRLRFVN